MAGGQKRNVTTTCGWGAIGTPREVNGKMKIHRKVCSVCNSSTTPAFNKVDAKKNGWNGIGSNDKKIKELIVNSQTTIDEEETTYKLKLKNTKSNNVVDNVNYILNVMDLIENN